MTAPDQGGVLFGPSAETAAAPGQAPMFEAWYVGAAAGRTMAQDFDESKYDAMRRAFLAGLAAQERPATGVTVDAKLRQVLKEHFLMTVVCDPEKLQDNPVCQCSRVHLGWHPSIGAAVDAWIDHVAEVLAARERPAPSEAAVCECGHPQADHAFRGEPDVCAWRKCKCPSYRQAAQERPPSARADEFARMKVKLSALAASMEDTVRPRENCELDDYAMSREFDDGAVHATAVTLRQLRAILGETAPSAGNQQPAPDEDEAQLPECCANGECEGP